MGFQARLCGSVRYTSQALDVEVKTARSKGKQWKTMENDPTTYVFGVSQTGGFSFSINQPLGWIWTQPFQEKKSFETFSSWCKEKLGPVLHVFQGPEQEVHVFFCPKYLYSNYLEQSWFIWSVLSARSLICRSLSQAHVQSFRIWLLSQILKRICAW